MYLTGVLKSATLRGPSLRKVAVGNVVALGMVSLFTDISSEMVTSVLPAYLVLALHLSVAQYGLLDGLYTGVTAFTRILGGYIADRFSQRKTVALIGYGMSAVAKIGLLLAGTTTSVGAVLAGDRTGKGLRTAPRDAMIAASVAEDDLGAAFGLHRAMDAVGAFLGPLVAVGILALGITGAVGASTYQPVFVASLAVSVLGLVVLSLFVRNSASAAAPEPVSRADVSVLLSSVNFRRLCAVAALLGLATVGDGFVYLALQRRDDLPAFAFPLLAAGTSVAFVVLAVPIGRLADRVGRWPVVVTGYACLVAVYVLLGVGSAPIVVILALYGTFYAATDGVLSALAVPLIAEKMRTTGLAVLQTGQALAYFASSVVFGLLWQHADVKTACVCAAVFSALALPAAAAMLRQPKTPTRGQPGARLEEQGTRA